jgi:hypothetical protein
MNKTTEALAAGYIAPKVLGGFKLRWIAYGALAYFGLRMMSKRGIFPKQADAALDAIDKGIDTVKNQVKGLASRKTAGEAASTSELH